MVRGVGAMRARCFADPPRGVRGELGSPCASRTSRPPYDAEVPLLDEVEAPSPDAWYFSRSTPRARFDCTNVRCRTVAQPGGSPQLALLRGGERLAAADQFFPSGVALLDLLRQTNLVVLREQRILADVGEIEPDEIFLVALDTLFRHPVTPCSSSLSSWTSKCRIRARARRPRMLLLLPFTIPGPSSGTQRTAPAQPREKRSWPSWASKSRSLSTRSRTRIAGRSAMGVDSADHPRYAATTSGSTSS